MKSMITNYGISKTGLIRKNNEDSISIKNSCYILADGMGGYDGGETASQLAVNAVKSFLTKYELHAINEQVLTNAIQFANQEVLKHKKQAMTLSSMGTTLIVVVIHGNVLYWAHVGDSRLYIFNNKIESITQITEDHSFVMHLFKEGKINFSEMKKHPRRNEITRAVGIKPELVVDKGHLTFDINSVMLLCSDGLTSMVTDQSINNCMKKHKIIKKFNLKACMNELIDMTYKAGAEDNVSVILACDESLENGVNYE